MRTARRACRPSGNTRPGDPPGMGAPSAPTPARLWFGLLAGPIAWSLHLLVSYALVSVVCATGLMILLHLVALVTALVALAAGVVAWRCWQATGAREPASRRGRVSRRAWMAFSGVVLSGLFLLSILVGGAASFFLSPCP
jgi:hypothetical protein